MEWQMNVRDIKPTSINKSVEITRKIVRACISANWSTVWFLMYPLNANNWMTFKTAVALDWIQCFIYYSAAHYHPSNIHQILKSVREMTDANSNMKNVFMDKIWCNHFSPFVLLLGLLNFYDSQRCNVTFFWLIKIHLASHRILLDGGFSGCHRILSSQIACRIFQTQYWESID